MADIFSGMSAAKPMEICDRLGWESSLQPFQVTGALMTLCRTVAELEAKVERLEAASKKEPEWLSQALNEGNGSYKP